MDTQLAQNGTSIITAQSVATTSLTAQEQAALTFRTAHFILAFGCPKTAASASASVSPSPGGPQVNL